MRYFEFCKWKKNKCSILSDHAACQMIRCYTNYFLLVFISNAIEFTQ